VALKAVLDARISQVGNTLMAHSYDEREAQCQPGQRRQLL
jgi:hypothetical protein